MIDSLRSTVGSLGLQPRCYPLLEKRSNHESFLEGRGWQGLSRSRWSSSWKGGNSSRCKEWGGGDFSAAARTAEAAASSQWEPGLLLGHYAVQVGWLQLWCCIYWWFINGNVKACEQGFYLLFFDVWRCDVITTKLFFVLVAADHSLHLLLAEEMQSLNRW